MQVDTHWKTGIAITFQSRWPSRPWWPSVSLQTKTLISTFHEGGEAKSKPELNSLWLQQNRPLARPQLRLHPVDLDLPDKNQKKKKQNNEQTLLLLTFTAAVCLGLPWHQVYPCLVAQHFLVVPHFLVLPGKENKAARWEIHFFYLKMSE